MDNQGLLGLIRKGNVEELHDALYSNPGDLLIV